MTRTSNGDNKNLLTVIKDKIFISKNLITVTTGTSDCDNRNVVTVINTKNFITTISLVRDEDIPLNSRTAHVAFWVALISFMCAWCGVLRRTGASRARVFPWFEGVFSS